ncbi:MAG TPA: SufD family Fe-S cluster assembly protein [Candidatus Avilachnospira avistercoris]|nr:SufD family Fe-S cluster assembly protein [Candidatus Avilachnospira avistercoris]
MDNIEKRILDEVLDIHKMPEGAMNIRLNGEAAERRSTANIDITSRPDGSGINIDIKPHTKNQTCCIPVVISKTGYKEMVINAFTIGEDCDVTIVAGCGIHNCGDQDSQHDGLHTFHVGKGSHVKYIERHYGEAADGRTGGRIMNPKTEIYLEEGAVLEMESTQIKGIDSTNRETKAVVGKDAKLILKERLLTNGTQVAESHMDAELIGEGASANLISRSVATDESRIVFYSNIEGKAPCHGHTECDSIIAGNAKVLAVPALDADHPDAELVHEAAIGKIAGEQLIKLETLGLTREEAEQAIIDGFLK